MLCIDLYRDQIVFRVLVAGSLVESISSRRYLSWMSVTNAWTENFTRAALIMQSAFIRSLDTFLRRGRDSERLFK